MCASPSYRKLRRDRQKRKSLLGVAERERLRLERAKGCDDWNQFSVQLNFAVSPDGLHVALSMPSGWYICGSERTVRSKIAAAVWGKASAGAQSC